MKLFINESTNRIEVTSDYNADFIRRVKLIGGKWVADKKAWAVTEENEAELMDLLRECYGYTPNEFESSSMIKVSYKACDFEEDNMVKIGTVVAATRYGRDRAVQVASGSVVTSGEFYGSGGSAKYPSVNAPEDLTMTTKLNKVIYDNLPEEKKALLSIVEESSPLEKLEKQREELLRQLAELDAKIAELK